MKIVSIALSRNKGTAKTTVEKALLIKNHGIEKDAHAGRWHRQISFLASEQLAAAQKKGLDVTFGDFAENIATVGVDWKTVPVGTRVKLGEKAVVEITQIGKTCHKKCDLYYRVGDCIMPREGVFAKVIEGGHIYNSDHVTFMDNFTT